MKKIVTLITFVFCISANAQITWNIGMNISTNTYGNMHPRIALDGSGKSNGDLGKNERSIRLLFKMEWNNVYHTCKIKSILAYYCNGKLDGAGYCILWRYGVCGSKTNTRIN